MALVYSANLECRSEVCCTWLAGNAGRKKSPKIRHLGIIAQLCRAVSQTLHGILPRAEFTLRLTLAFSYIGSVTVRHSSSGRQRKFAASYREWNYGTFAEGATYIRLGRPSRWASAHIRVLLISSRTFLYRTCTEIVCW